MDEHLGRVRSAAVGSRNEALNRAAFCFGQLEEAGRIDAERVRWLLWDACAAYRADEGNGAARATIVSGWDAGRGNPLHREEDSAFSPGSGRPVNGSTPMLAAPRGLPFWGFSSSKPSKTWMGPRTRATVTANGTGAAGYRAVVEKPGVESLASSEANAEAPRHSLPLEHRPGSKPSVGAAQPRLPVTVRFLRASRAGEEDRLCRMR